jgi:hypothetical protein
MAPSVLAALAGPVGNLTLSSPGTMNTNQPARANFFFSTLGGGAASRGHEARLGCFSPDRGFCRRLASAWTAQEFPGVPAADSSSGSNAYSPKMGVCRTMMGKPENSTNLVQGDLNPSSPVEKKGLRRPTCNARGTICWGTAENPPHHSDFFLLYLTGTRNSVNRHRLPRKNQMFEGGQYASADKPQQQC